MDMRSLLTLPNRLMRPVRKSDEEGQGRQMRILIISDTHRRDENFLKLIERVKPLDLLIHCGDLEENEALFLEKAGCPAQIIAGNNDFFSSLPRELEFNIGKYRVWLTHGHIYYVSMGGGYCDVRPHPQAGGGDWENADGSQPGKPFLSQTGWEKAVLYPDGTG